MAAYDAVVIGGGHNGLVAAAYLARARMRVVVLEARHKTGGAATTDAPWPEAPQFKVTTLSYVMSLMPPSIVRELELKRHGYKVHPMGPYYQAWPDGRSLKLYADDAPKNRDGIARFSPKDAEAMPKWDAWLQGLADVLAPLLMGFPPKMGSTRWSDVRDQLRLAWRYRGLGVRGVADVTRLMTMSITDLLDEWFESEEVKAGIALNGVIGTWAGPDEPGTAYVMAHHSIGDVGDGHLGAWGFPEGGMGAVADAIRRSAEAAGAEVRTGSRVGRVLVKRGLDPTLCPEGFHIMSMFTQWVPHEWSAEPHTEDLEAYADRMIDAYTELAPNFKSSILQRQVIGPHQLEQEYRLIGGNIFHGELSAEQLFHMRPAPGYADYRTPIAGLYQASSATHGGGGVSGVPGHHAARQILKDRSR